jgi:hypothetical protein
MTMPFFVYASSSSASPAPSFRATQACTRLLNPVCGCDNVTYDNLCLASAAGASLQALGSCGPDPGVGAGSCDRDSDCAAANQYCQFRDGECGGLGVCVDTPQVRTPLQHRTHRTNRTRGG